MYIKLKWEEWYKLAEIYYNYHGNLRVKQSFKTNNGYEYDESGYLLGIWINNQHSRCKQGLLTTEQRQKLELLGINFENTHDFKWDRMYSLAKEYYQCHKTLKISYMFKTLNGYDYNEKGYPLGSWINVQRMSYKQGTLSEERIQKLEKIGMIFENVWQDNWNEMYQLAQKYYEYYGHLKVPLKFKTKDGYKRNEQGKNLGCWINIQRRFYKSKQLSQEYIKRLEQIGMMFEDVQNKEWERIYNLVKIYYENYGNLKINREFRTKDGYTYDEKGWCLYNWLDAQRTMYKKNKLSIERIKKLELIGMIFEIRKNTNENIALCEKYGIDYKQNKLIIDSIAYRELISKINYLTSLEMPLTIDNQLHPIFAMGNVNMQVRYGISLETLIIEYSKIDNKIKTL